MGELKYSKRIPGDDQVAVELRRAVHAGEVEAIQRLLRNDPALASAKLGSKDSGTATPFILSLTGPATSPTARRSSGS